MTIPHRLLRGTLLADPHRVVSRVDRLVLIAHPAPRVELVEGLAEVPAGRVVLARCYWLRLRRSVVLRIRPTRIESLRTGRQVLYFKVLSMLRTA
jgi:hypothetical protein